MIYIINIDEKLKVINMTNDTQFNEEINMYNINQNSYEQNMYTLIISRHLQRKKEAKEGS